MKEYMCPYCDQRMKKKHRCSNCHSFVWKPVVIDSHPEVFVDTEPDYISQAISDEKYRYGNSDRYVSMDAHPYDNAHGGGQQDAYAYEDKSKPSTYKVDIPSGNKQKKEKRKKRKKEGRKGNILGRIFVIFIIILAIFYVIGQADEEGWFEDGEDYSYEEDETELTDDQVIAAGEECTGDYHMDVDKDDYIAWIEGTLVGTYFGADDYSQDSRNLLYDYGDGDTTSYYEVTRMYTFSDDVGGYYLVDWDTASERLHRISFSANDLTMIDELIRNVWTFLDPEADTGSAAYSRMLEDIFAEAKAEGYYSDYEGEYSFYISYSEYTGGEEYWYVSFGGND